MGSHIPQLGDRVRDLIRHVNDLVQAHNQLAHAHRLQGVRVEALQLLLLRTGHTHAADGSVVALTPEALDAAVKDAIEGLRAEAEKTESAPPVDDTETASVAPADEAAVA